MHPYLSQQLADVLWNEVTECVCALHSSVLADVRTCILHSTTIQPLGEQSEMRTAE